ncbi:MAG TPA: hypothetical protein VN282_11565 [Pyrinomonadaceae bacterium]|nr:hypothetical protein [Pyrinomonadaceae bacterium]
MSASVLTRPSIELTIEGIIVLLFERDAQGQVTACLAGVVRNVPGHDLEVKGTKFDQAGNSTAFAFKPVEPRLRLEVGGTTQTGIRFAGAGAPIKRVCDADDRSFSWVLDFEGKELHGREIGADVDQFHPILRINNGELFTKVVSVNHLLVRAAGTPDAPVTLIGRVATQVGVAVELDRPESVAEFSNGAAQTITVRHGERLEATLALTCPTDDPRRGGLARGHANHYYNAVGNKLPVGERKVFSSTKFEHPGAGPLIISPEASCLVATMSGSPIEQVVRRTDSTETAGGACPSHEGSARAGRTIWARLRRLLRKIRGAS